jgi:hypothetical protein
MDYGVFLIIAAILLLVILQRLNHYAGVRLNRKLCKKWNLEYKLIERLSASIFGSDAFDEKIIEEYWKAFSSASTSSPKDASTSPHKDASIDDEAWNTYITRKLNNFG